MADRTEIEVPATGQLPPDPPPVSDQPSDDQVSPRERMMAQIAANYERQRAQEMERGDVLHREAVEAGLAFPGEEADPPPADPPPATPEPPAPAKGDPPAQQPPAQAQQPQLVPIDLGNGAPVYVTQDQLVQLARMGAVANQTIHEWNTRQTFQQPEPAAPQGQQRVVERPAAAPQIDQARIRETVRRIQFGTEDDGAQALGDLVQHVTQAQPQIDTNALIQQATQRATQEALARVQLAREIDIIKQEYPEITGNPQLSALAHMHVQQIQRDAAMLGRPLSSLDIYREAGNRVLDLLGRPRPGSETAPQPQQAAPQPPTQAARPLVQARPNVDARKREAPRQTGQVIDRRSVVPEPPRAKSAADIVEDMRKARGQPSLR